MQRYGAPAAFSVSRALFQQFILISDMVRTRGGSCVRPRVRFSTPERETTTPVPAPVPSPVPRPYLTSLWDSDVIRHGWDLGPHPQCPGGELGGPGPPSGPALRAQVSHHLLGLHHHQSHHLLRRHPHLSYHQPHGSGGPCS